MTSRTLLLCWGLLLAYCTVVAAEAKPEPAGFRCSGQGLRTLLKDRSSKLGVALTTDEALENQRLTMVTPDLDERSFRALVKELLDAGPDTTVNWESVGTGWKLNESLNRRQLRARLKEQDLRAFTEFLGQEAKWIKEGAPKELEEAGQDSRLISAIEQRRGIAGLFTSLGERDLETVLKGKPLRIKVGMAPDDIRLGLRTYLRSAGHLQQADDAKLDEQVLVFVLGRSPTDPLGARIFESRIDPEHGVWERRTATSLRIPHSLPIPALQGVFHLPKVDEGDNSPRVTLNLAPKAGEQDGAAILQTFDEAITTLADGSGLSIVADGYIRAPTRFPANLRAQNYPLRQLLDEYCRIWGCHWRPSKTQPNTLLIRANGWWMEDDADVPDEQLKPLELELGSGRNPSFETLLHFAELTDSQAHKLLESGVVPGATGVVKPLWHDSLGAKPCLQLFNRLSAQQKDRVLSPEGLPLRDVSPELATRWLESTLVAVVGVEPSERSLIFRVSRLAGDGSLPPGYQVELSIPNGRRWTTLIRPPARRAANPSGEPAAGSGGK